MMKKKNMYLLLSVMFIFNTFNILVDTNIIYAEKKIMINISKQKLFLYQDDIIVKEYIISSSKYGLGNKVNSNKTPLGRHEIVNKIGEGAKLGAIFIARKNTGKVSEIFTDKISRKRDFVTTRILRLKGLEDLNSNSYKRYIYIHGTHEEGFLGKVASLGCIRMKNSDIVELFGLVKVGVTVNINEKWK